MTLAAIHAAATAATAATFNPGHPMLAYIRHAFTVLIESRARHHAPADAACSRFTVLIERTLTMPQGAPLLMRRQH